MPEVFSNYSLRSKQKRPCMCVVLLPLPYCIMEAEKVGVDDEVHPKGKCL